jgi:hypothetical protein
VNLVQDWLKWTKKEWTTDEWQWGVNLFWICYVGQHPLFPSSTPSKPSIEWMPWDSNLIPIEGKYILDHFSLMVEDDDIPAKSSAARINILKSWFEVGTRGRVQVLLGFEDGIQ